MYLETEKFQIQYQQLHPTAECNRYNFSMMQNTIIRVKLLISYGSFMQIFTDYVITKNELMPVC